MRIGLFLSSEECDPRELVRQAMLAERYGFDGLWVSDHFHPWNDDQGHSGFVWATIGAIAHATERMHVTTAVTCPTIRMHPALVAHAAATSAVLLGGRFTLGLGSGEALNEHVLGDRWPEADERLEMLEEAIEVIRALWRGRVTSHRGRHYRVANARLYDLPERPPEILMSAFGPKSTALAARVADGLCTTAPVKDAVESFREQAGERKRVAGGLKVCWGDDEGRARAIAHRLWPNDPLPGELSQVIPTTAHFEQASGLVSEDMVAREIPCGPDLERQAEMIDRYADAGFDELYVQQVGLGDEPDGGERFFETYAREILPRHRRSHGNGRGAIARAAHSTA